MTDHLTYIHCIRNICAVFKALTDPLVALPGRAISIFGKGIMAENRLPHTTPLPLTRASI